MIDAARLSAFSALDDVVRKKAYSNLAIKKHSQNIEGKDRAFASALVYGALEKLITLDYILEKYIKKSPKPIIRNILRMGVYQIYFMDTVPDHAAVVTSSELAKKLGKQGASGFINGVLRNAARDKDKFEISENTGGIKYLSVKYSFPEWIIKMWTDQLGTEESQKLISYEKDNLFALYPNTLRGLSFEAFKEELEKRAVRFEKGKLLEDVLRTDGGIFSTGLFESGKVAVQGEASHLAAKVAVENNPKKVLDICAAPGGKTAAMAHFNPEAEYTACDISENRVNIMKKQFERLSVKARVLCLDASIETDALGEFDTVLVDAPCSVLGTVFSSPEVRYNKSPKDLKEIVKTQKAIIRNAALHVNKGGRLIYATCTINRAENYDVVKDFLDENTRFKPVLPEAFCGIINDKRFDGAGVQLLPHKDETAGFYISCLERANG